MFNKAPEAFLFQDNNNWNLTKCCWEQESIWDKGKEGSVFVTVISYYGLPFYLIPKAIVLFTKFEGNF